MASVGDSIQYAFYPSYDSVEYNADETSSGMVIYRLQTEQKTYYGKAVMMK